MVNDSSLGGVPQFAFELDTQKGVMSLLASVRASELTPEQKNELRDLAFLYINGGKDQSVRITLQQKIVSHGLQPLAPITPPAPPQPEPSLFGTSRPAPSFSFTVSAPVISTSSEPVPPVQSEPTPTPVPEPIPVPPAQPAPAPAPIPVPVPQLAVEIQAEPTPEPAAAVIPPVQPAPVSQAETTPVPEPIPVPPAQPAPLTEAPVVVVPQAAPIPTTSYDPEITMQRIREIKSLVNERVGNPVNLVDINNEVGREYMAALLDAMKKLNSGTSVVSAMRRLEDAFKVVEKTLEAHESGVVASSQSVPVSSPQPAPEPVSTPPSLPVSELPHPPIDIKPQPVVEAQAVPSFVSIPEPISQLPVPPPEFQFKPIPEPVVESVYQSEPELVAVPEPIPEPEPELVLEQVPVPPSMPTPTPEKEMAAPWQDPENIISAREDVQTREPKVSPVHVVPIGAPAPIPQKKSASDIESAWGPATDTLQPVVDDGRVLSLAESEQKLHVITDLPSADEISTSATGDPLFTKEIDDGLQQLLLEWSLFKKSGLFGTGPKGSEHPLFKKLAGLQIPLLLAGRFEGATQEIKQSITDYMNGWRYEQGIIYEQGETFEHYLRRVIRHILDLQKKRQNP